MTSFIVVFLVVFLLCLIDCIFGVTKKLLDYSSARDNRIAVEKAYLNGLKIEYRHKQGYRPRWRVLTSLSTNNPSIVHFNWKIFYYRVKKPVKSRKKSINKDIKLDMGT